MEGNITKQKKETKPKKRQVMHNAIAHHPLTDAQAVIQPSWPALPVYILNMSSYGMEYPFGSFRSAVLAMLPPSFLCICFLAEHGKLKIP